MQYDMIYYTESYDLLYIPAFHETPNQIAVDETTPTTNYADSVLQNTVCAIINTSLWCTVFNNQFIIYVKNQPRKLLKVCPAVHRSHLKCKGI